MAGIKIRFRLTPRGAVILAAALIAFVVVYNHLVEASVQRLREGLRQTLVTECSRREFLRSGVTPNDLSGAEEMAKAMAACKGIQIAVISANGGILLPVMVRVELSGQGYVPADGGVWYLKTGRTRIFPFTIYNLITDDWYIDPLPKDRGMEPLYYLRF